MAINFIRPQFEQQMSEADRIRMEEADRQRSKDRAIQAIGQFGINKEQERRNKRREALERLDLSMKLSTATGRPVSPEEVDQYLMAEQQPQQSQGEQKKTGASSLYGDIADMAKAKRARDQRRQEIEKLQFEKLQREVGESALPFEQTRSGQEYKFKEAQKQAAKKEEEMEKSFVPGLGYAQTPQDAKDLKDATQQKAKFDSQIGELIELRKKFGGEVVDRAAVARAKQLSKDLLLTYKNMAKLGVLSQQDEAIINAIIPSDPLEFTPLAMLPGQSDPIIKQLESFKQDSQRDYDTRLALRLKGGQGVAKKGSQAPQIKPEIAQKVQSYTPEQAEARKAELKAKARGVGVR